MRGISVLRWSYQVFWFFAGHARYFSFSLVIPGISVLRRSYQVLLRDYFKWHQNKHKSISLRPCMKRKLKSMKLLSRPLLFVLLISGFSVSAQDYREKDFKMITEDALKAQLGFLASDWTEGRETGERGAFLAADYIASMLQLFGAKPAGDIVNVYDPATRSIQQQRSYFQTFTLESINPGEEQDLSILTSGDGIERSISFDYLTDFRVNPNYPGGDIKAAVVFVGYGNEEDYKNEDVKDKFVLRLAGQAPGSGDENDPYSRYRLDREKDMIANEKGVAGIIETDPDESSIRWAEIKDFMNMSPSENRRYSSGQRLAIPRDKANSNPSKVIVSQRVANTILSGTGLEIDDLVKGNEIRHGTIKNITIHLKTSVKSTQVKVRNVLGMIEGKNKDEIIVLGAHYDHIGMNAGYINNGADDNGSGTVGVVTLARAIQALDEQPEKTIVFALWTGEEKGLLGSRYFVDNPTVPLKNIKANVNFDMISRYVSDDQPNKVTMTYTASKEFFKDITIKNLEMYGIEIDPDYQASDNPPGGSDHRSFVSKGIPIMRFKPGHREEYHTPEDEVSTIDWDIMQKIVMLSFLNIMDMANTDW
ncbi:MAG: M20/M25/M40 family metallo-hydrolase [Bacteroidota bacterium]